MVNQESRDDSGAIQEAQERHLEGHPVPTAPVSPLAPEVPDDEFKYIQSARQTFIETGRPPKGFGVKVYGDRIIVRKLGK